MTEIVDLEVIVKVKIEAVYQEDANIKKVEDLLAKYGMAICIEPHVLLATPKIAKQKE